MGRLDSKTPDDFALGGSRDKGAIIAEEVGAPALGGWSVFWFRV
jgi:hypothetical protein